MLCAASFTDWRQRKIPNKLLLPSFITALLINFFQSGQTGLLSSLSGAVIGFVLLLVPYLLGGMGAGDVKLLMVIGSFGGAKLVIYSFLFGAIAGGIISAYILIYNAVRHKNIVSLPYGIPLSLGTLVYLLVTYM
jgi:prepilin peptidase CpaA